MDKRFHNQTNTEVKDSVTSCNSRAPFFKKKQTKTNQTNKTPDKLKANPQLKLTLVTVVSMGEKHLCD